MKMRNLFLLSLFFASFFVWAEIGRTPSNSESVNIYFLDVGQGDSTLIQKNDHQILIDGGPDDSILVELGEAMPLMDRKIETVILTHPHADHLIGINQVIDRYEIGRIYFSGTNYDSNAYEEFLAKVKSRDIPISIPKIGETITFFEDGKMDFLWPGERYENQAIQNLNNTSIVSRFCYYAECVLLTGDIETDEQKEMWDYYSSSGREKLREIFQAQIIKISHHGSINGTNQTLLDIAQPDYAVIHVGADNKFGHPHAQTLDLLQKSNINIYLTERQGTSEFTLNKSGISEKKK